MEIANCFLLDGSRVNALASKIHIVNDRTGLQVGGGPTAMTCRDKFFFKVHKII